MPLVFLSYSRNDLDAANGLRELLRAAGIDVFKDDSSIRAGDRWFDSLEATLANCAAFAVLVGRDGIERWVGAETQVALARHFGARGDMLRLPILPVLLGETQATLLPPFLALFQAARWAPGQPLPEGLIAAIRASQVQFAPPAALRDECPYLGLAAFRTEDSALFFGRSNETLEALKGLGDTRQTNPEQLQGAGGPGYRRWLQIEGNSGSGKSSLVQAGMLPMIERGALWPRTGFADWRVLGPMMPGRDPLAKLAEVIEFALKPDPATRDIGALNARLRQPDATALAFYLRNFQQKGQAFLLIVDQFEELFTFAAPESRQAFDAQLAHALGDAECKLFVISTVRADFLDRIEQLPRLCELYNSHCERYLLPGITPEGLREAIEMPARLAGLDVGHVSAAIVADARDEPGALPLVENALTTLWQEAERDAQGRRIRLSGHLFEARGKLAGMLSAGADRLLGAIEQALPGKGRKAALELLLALTRVSPDGRHTRLRITRDEALMVAGDSKPAAGDLVLQRLAGQHAHDAPGDVQTQVLRLVTTSVERNAEGDDVAWVDLIHETLIRARTRPDGTREAYWKTLYDYIDANRDRDLLRQQLALQIGRYQRAGRLTRWWHLAGWGEWMGYRRLQLPRAGSEGRFLARSRRVLIGQAVAALLVLAPLAESAWWTYVNNLPLDYILYQLQWYAGFGSIPETVEIRPGEFEMGCKPGRDDVEGVKCDENEPAVTKVTLNHPCAMGVYEVTFREYDYYLWSTVARGRSPESFPGDSGFGRIGRPVNNVSWTDAQAYVRWLSVKTEQSWRLPSEKEWEYAARAGTDTAFWWGRKNDPGHANCFGCDGAPAGTKTLPVGHYAANPWGLHDTAGNVWEWVQNAYEKEAEDAGVGDAHVLRGGAWFTPPEYARAAARTGIHSVRRDNRFGFRVCRGSPIE